MAWAAVAGAAIGAVGSSMGGGGGGGGSQTASKEPWAEAAPWIKDNIKTGQDLQRYYQQNPFNSLQQTGYQNQFSDLDQFRNQMAPGLMNFANKLMGSNYQRASAGTEIGATNPYAAQAMMPAMTQIAARQRSQGMGGGAQGGLMGGMGTAQGGMGTSMGGGQNPSLAGIRADWDGTGEVLLDGPVTQNALLASPLYGRPTGASTPSGGLFSAPQGQSYGLLDFQQLNPFTSPNGIQAMPKPMADDKTIQQLVQEELDRQRYGQVDGYLAANGSA